MLARLDPEEANDERFLKKVHVHSPGLISMAYRAPTIDERQALLNSVKAKGGNVPLYLKADEAAGSAIAEEMAPVNVEAMAPVKIDA